jgi:isochorismate hydrolase
MEQKNLQQFFEDHEEDFLEFDLIQDKLSNRPDLHAFLLLDRLVPGSGDIVGSAAHDEIFLSTDVEELLKVATEDQLIELSRCGIFYNEEHECLMSYV